MIRKEVTCAIEPGAAPRTLRFILSTGDVDRLGDTIDPDGWQLDGYRANPVILFGHRHDVPAIARTVEIGVVGGALKGTAEFPPPGIHPLADTVYGLAKSGFLRAASVGFQPVTATPNRSGGYDYTEQILHEWSVVNVPALAAAEIEASMGATAAVQKWLAGAGRDAAMVRFELVEDDAPEVILRVVEDELIRLDPHDLAVALRTHIAHEVRSEFTRREHGMVVVDPQMVATVLRDTLRGEIRAAVTSTLGRLRGRID